LWEAHAYDRLEAMLVSEGILQAADVSFGRQILLQAGDDGLLLPGGGFWQLLAALLGGVLEP